MPHPGLASGGVRWLMPPDGAGTLTDATLLELAMHEAAAATATARGGGLGGGRGGGGWWGAGG